jgi:hypothetical protein
MLRGICRIAGILTAERDEKIAEALKGPHNIETLDRVIEIINKPTLMPSFYPPTRLNPTPSFVEVTVAKKIPLHRGEHSLGVLGTIFREYEQMVCEDYQAGITKKFVGWPEEIQKELFYELIGACRLPLETHFLHGKDYIERKLKKILLDKDKDVVTQELTFSFYLIAVEEKYKTECKFFPEGKCKKGDQCMYVHKVV